MTSHWRFGSDEDHRTWLEGEDRRGSRRTPPPDPQPVAQRHACGGFLRGTVHDVRHTRLVTALCDRCGATGYIATRGAR